MTQQNIAYNWNIINKFTLTHALLLVVLRSSLPKPSLPRPSLPSAVWVYWNMHSYHCCNSCS